MDGYITKPSDNLDFLQVVEMPREDYGYSQFNGQIDTVIFGKRTYDWVMQHVGEFHHQGKETYALTRQKLDLNGTINFYLGHLVELISKLKSQSDKHIFVDGAAL